MKINFTKKEYRLLVDMLYLADWVLNSHTVETNYPEHEALKEKLLSHYRELGAEDIVEHSKIVEGYYLTQVYEEHVRQQMIVPYEDDVFWEELIDRLGERDVIQALGEQQYQSLDGLERIKQVEARKEFYAQEFAERGLTGLKMTEEPENKKAHLSTKNE